MIYDYTLFIQDELLEFLNYFGAKIDADLKFEF